MSGAMAFDAGELESAISSVIFEIIEREKSVSSAASQVSGEELRLVLNYLLHLDNLTLSFHW